MILIAIVLLFNFFGYYLLQVKSRENEKLVQIVDIAARQRMLSQVISKDIILLLRANLKPERKQNVSSSLSSQIKAKVFKSY